MENSIQLNGFPEKEARDIIQKVKEIGEVIKGTGFFGSLSMTLTNIDKSTEALLLCGCSDERGDAFRYFPSQPRSGGPNEDESFITARDV